MTTAAPHAVALDNALLAGLAGRADALAVLPSLAGIAQARGCGCSGKQRKAADAVRAEVDALPDSGLAAVKALVHADVLVYYVADAGGTPRERRR